MASIPHVTVQHPMEWEEDIKILKKVLKIRAKADIFYVAIKQFMINQKPAIEQYRSLTEKELEIKKSMKIRGERQC